jgi:hypothetical protein
MHCDNGVAVTLYTIETNNNNNNIPWKQIIFLFNTGNIYSRKVDFVGSTVINVACLFRRNIFIKYRLTYEISSKR